MFFPGTRFEPPRAVIRARILNRSSPRILFAGPRQPEELPTFLRAGT
jgi:hypothetical protein